MKKDQNRQGQNPFSLSFGRKPAQYISRLVQTEEIIEDFQQDRPVSQVYMITGVRGAGKTVFMTNIAHEFEEEEDWIVLELNPNLDLRKELTAALYAQPAMAAYFAEARIDLSFFGLGVTIKKAPPVSDYDTALSRMLDVIRKKHRRVLVCIDEVSNTEQMRVFASTFQILIRKDYPLHLLMTGLYENIYDLQNEKNLTFLYRAPKVQLEPLNYAAMKASYEHTLGVPEQEAGRMANLVKGYPYAFQLLGYPYWTRRPAVPDDVMALFDQYLDEYVYSKIWSELSAKDRMILQAMVHTGKGSVRELREYLRMPSNTFSVYRERLIRKGVISSPERGRVVFQLPRFEKFTALKMEQEEV